MRQPPPPRIPIITLLTDFGLQDEYVAVLKGIIFCHCPMARIVDISHLVPPQSIFTAMFLLNRSFHHFPLETVHLAVVDPEVGTERAVLAITAHGHTFVGPDNGIFTPLLTQESTAQVYRLDLASPRPGRISATFHGRDIMAPVAAKIAGGVPPASLGPKIPVTECCLLDRSFPRLIGSSLHGEIVHIDTFGNLCSNLRRQDLMAVSTPDRFRVVIAGSREVPLVTTYATAPRHTVVALFDSNDFLEIACNQGHAARHLELGLGAEITVTWVAGPTDERQRII